jgi:hypothetical protein
MKTSGIRYSQELCTIHLRGRLMQSGNISPKLHITMDYLEYVKPPFNSSTLESKLIITPHQTKSIDNPKNSYNPISFSYKSINVNCVCLEGTPKAFDAIVDDLDGNPVLFWFDPTLLPTECIASFITNWKDHITKGKNIALGIVIPVGETNQKEDAAFELWRANAFGVSNVPKLSSPIWWYPSLLRGRKALEDAAEDLKPYDIFPLLEFPNRSIQWGERTLTNHYQMLEKYRTRTRNIIYLDSLRPDQAFDQLYRTLNAKPTPNVSISLPVLTPGGSTNGFITTLLAGALTGSYFLTPRNEIPISSNEKTQGVMILRKYT